MVPDADLAAKVAHRCPEAFDRLLVDGNSPRQRWCELYERRQDHPSSDSSGCTVQTLIADP